MSGVKSLIKKIKRNVVVNMSKVAETNSDDMAKIEQVKERGTFVEGSSLWGNIPAKVEKEAVGRKITNGNDVYYTADSTSSISKQRFFGDPRNIFPAEVDATIRSFTVMYNDDFAFAKIWKNVTRVEGEGEVPPFEVELNGKIVFASSEDVDLNDINSIRYALRDNPKASFFMDKYFIVTDEEREKYNNYAKYREKLEKDKLEKARQESLKIESEQKQVKKAEENAKKQAKKDKMVAQKIQAEYKDRFFG